MKYTIIFACLLYSNICHSQFRNTLWCFGDSAAIDFRDTSNASVSFSSINSRGSCCSIADSTGNLIFYASTPEPILYQAGVNWRGAIYNKQHSIMQNGDTLFGAGGFQEYAIVPYPEHKSLFYLFAIGYLSSYNGMYYQLIDISQDGGLGSVTVKNIKLLDSTLVDDLIAVKHGNGRDWWIITHQSLNNSLNRYYKYLIAPNGIQGPFIQNIGAFNGENLGKSAFTKDGNKYAYVNYRGLVETMDFDRCSGNFSNPVIISTQTSFPFPNLWDVEFSPDGNVLYVTSEYNPPSNTTSYLFQYDLTAPDIAASKDTLETFFSPAVAGALKLAPDDRIYLSCYYQPPSIPYYPYPDSVRNYVNENLSVINNPNVLGSGCNLSLFSFYLGGRRTYTGLPNNPDYSLGPLIGSSCDTINSGIQQINSGNCFGISVYPNPVSNGEINFSCSSSTESKTIAIFNTDGQEVGRYELPKNSSTLRVRLPMLAKGVYLARLIGKELSANVKFVVE